MLNFSNSIVLSAYVRCVCAYVYRNICAACVRSRFEDCICRTQICRTSLHNPARCTEI